MLASLPRKRLTRRMVGAVDLFVTVHAPAIDDPHALALNGEIVVDGRRMSRADMTALTEHRKLGDEQPIVGGTVWIVTGDAALTTCGMFEQERPALLCVTGNACLVDPVADAQQAYVRRSVRVMTRRALHLVFRQWHVHGSIDLRGLHLVARGAKCDFARRLQMCGVRLGRVDAVARDAGKVARVVRASLPRGVRRACVT